MSITDKVAVRGGADYTFVCSKIPFAITCSTDLPHAEHNLIDLELVNKMKISLKNIKVKRNILMGKNVRYVGSISQTIQCVNRGKVCGTIHLQALVVRDLFSLFNVDCIASSKTYQRLTGRKPPKPSKEEDDMDEEEDDDAEDDAAEDDDDRDDTAEDDDAEDDEEYAAKEGNNEKDDHDNDTAGEVNIGDIAWDWGYKDVPTVNELYPNETPEDNARWLDELHQTRPQPPFIGNKKYRKKFNTCSGVERREEEVFCKLCFSTGQPLSMVKSHHTLHISCPAMPDDEKETIYGPNWVARMYGYPT